MQSELTDNDTNEVISVDPEQEQPDSTIKWKESIKLWDIDLELLLHEFENWDIPWKIYGLSKDIRDYGLVSLQK